MIVLTTPLAIPSIQPFTLYWDRATFLTASLKSSRQVTAIGLESLRLMREITHTLLRSAHSDYMPDDRNDFVTLVTPQIDDKEFTAWLKANRGRRLALQQFHLDRANYSLGFVRTPLLHGTPHVFHQWRTPPPDVEEIEV